METSGKTDSLETNDVGAENTTSFNQDSTKAGEGTADSPREGKGPKVFCDPVHGHITLHPLLAQIVDTPQFQRLRHIRQLGSTYFVYPGASHNRFEHCIGTAHLAGKLARKIQQQINSAIDKKIQNGGSTEGEEKKNRVTDEDVLCVEMAGLCHDLGHGPFSHVFDDAILRRLRPGYKWTHEKGSCDMLQHLIDKNKIDYKSHDLNEADIEFVKEMIDAKEVKDVSFLNKLISNLKSDSLAPADVAFLKKMIEEKDVKDESILIEKIELHNLSPTEIELIKEMIEADKKWPYNGRGEEKSFLYEIISNKRNGVDVDKWDYFARDCHHLGIRNSFDHNRFMEFIKVDKLDGQRLQICARDKECENLYEMFHTRSFLHRRAYQHKVAKVIDCMIGDAMVLANPYVTILGKGGERKKISECADDPVAYTKLNDGILDLIVYLAETEPNKQDIEKRLTEIEKKIKEGQKILGDEKKNIYLAETEPTMQENEDHLKEIKKKTKEEQELLRDEKKKWEDEKTKKSNLGKARDILNDVIHRKFYEQIGVIKSKTVGKTLQSHITVCGETTPIVVERDLVDNIRKELKEAKNGKKKKEDEVTPNIGDVEYLTEKGLALSVRKVDYGMDGENPVDKFLFYKKPDPKNPDSEKPFYMKNTDVSAMLPGVFQEVEVLIFCKESENEKVETAKKCFKEWGKKKFRDEQ